MTKEPRNREEMGEERPGQDQDKHRDDDNSRREKSDAGDQQMSAGRDGGQGGGGSDRADKGGQGGQGGQNRDADKKNRDQGDQSRGNPQQGSPN